MKAAGPFVLLTAVVAAVAYRLSWISQAALNAVWVTLVIGFIVWVAWKGRS